jgi:hypothetical protein
MSFHKTKTLLTRGRCRCFSSGAKAVQARFFTNPSESSSCYSSSIFYASVVTSALGLVGVMSLPGTKSSVLNSGSMVTSNFTLTEPVRQPRNVMLHRMRSAAGRGLNDKYNVDWTTVLGGKN